MSAKRRKTHPDRQAYGPPSHRLPQLLRARRQVHDLQPPGGRGRPELRHRDRQGHRRQWRYRRIRGSRHADAFVQEQSRRAGHQVQRQRPHREARGAAPALQEVLHAHRCQLRADRGKARQSR